MTHAAELCLHYQVAFQFCGMLGALHQMHVISDSKSYQMQRGVHVEQY